MSSLLGLLIFRAAVSTPFQDELTFNALFAALAQGEFPNLRELVAAHNGHPYLLLKSLIAVTLLGELPWTWMMYAQVVVLAFCALLLYSLRKEQMRRAGAIVILLVLLSPRQWENLYWAMQLAFPLFLLFSLVAFASVERYVRGGEVHWGYLALAAGFLASLSNGAGIISLILVAATLLGVRRSGAVALSSLVVLALGGALFLLSQELAPRSGVGSGPLAPWPVAEHIARMAAQQFIDLEGRRATAVFVGVLALGVAAYCVLRALPVWRQHGFELLCIALGVISIAAVTVSRVSAGIFQPDAPRYLPLLAPLTIGCALLLNRFAPRWGQWVLLAVVAAGYLLGLRTEWKMASHRQENYLAAQRELCLTGRLHPVHNMNGQIRGQALRDIRRLFCVTGEATAARVDHSNIARFEATGFHREASQTWVSPELILAIPLEEKATHVEVVGWIPDLSAYPERRFAIEIAADSTPVVSKAVERPGEFSVAAKLPDAATTIRVRGTKRKPVHSDARALSWVLVEVRFE